MKLVVIAVNQSRRIQNENIHNPHEEGSISKSQTASVKLMFTVLFNQNRCLLMQF